MMRQILIDHARQFAAAKRGGNAITLAFDEAPDPVGSKVNLDLIALNDAMVELEALDSRQCKIVELRFFGGLTIEETAEAIEISPATAKREWATARLWLHRAINGSSSSNSNPAP